MAIDRKDYQYIHNTLEKKSITNNDNTLKVGSKVKNLLVELKEENIWNADFPDYYGSKPPECWEPFSTKGETVQEIISATYGQPGVQQMITTTPGGNSFDIMEGPNTLAVNPPSIQPQSNLKNKIYYKWTYTRTFEQDVTNITVKNALSSSLYDDANYEWIGDRAIRCYFYSTSKTVLGSLSYNIKKSPTQDETVEKGILYYTTSIKPKTAYVLQVVNAILPSNITTENRNKITLTNSNNTPRDINFNNYLFFETGENEINIRLSIEGLSFGYQIYGLDANNQIYELRCFKTATQAKVFLFEAKHPWIVDNNGIITGLTEAELNVPQKSSNIPVKASFSANQLAALFKEAPSLHISEIGKTLTIPLPNSILENGEWEWKTKVLWQYAGQSTNYPKIMDNIYLLVYRNFLTEEIRDYNNIKITTQYGLLRTIQKTCSNSKDEYAQEIDYKIQLNQKFISGISPNSVKQLDGTLKWNFLPIIFNVPTSTKAIGQITNIDLCILPLLGYNYTYGMMNNKSDIYKYTAISFAWGRKEGGKFVRLSDFSTPIIVDRSTITISKNIYDDTKYDLTPPKQSDLKDLKLTLRDSTKYYPFPAIYLEEVAKTTDTINE